MLPVKAFQIPDTEGRNNLLENLGDGYGRLWLVIDKKSFWVWGLMGRGGKEEWGEEYEEREMVGFKIWVKAMDLKVKEATSTMRHGIEVTKTPVSYRAIRRQMTLALG